MRLLTIFAAAATLLLAVPAYAQDSGSTGSTGPNGVDQTFVTKAVHSNNMEINQAQGELRASQDPGIVLFANTMIKDHTAANSQLAAIAKGLNLSFPASHVQQGDSSSAGTPPPAASNGSGAASGMPAKTYMTMQVRAHQAAIALYQGEARNGGSEQLRTYAAQTLPTIKAHLAMAQQYLTSGTVSPEVTPTPAGRLR